MKKEARSEHFIGTPKEIAEQFDKDLTEAIHITSVQNRYHTFGLYISRRLYRIVAAYFGANMCFHARGTPTIKGLDVGKIINDQYRETMMFGTYAVMGGEVFDGLPGVYMYREKESEDEG